MDHRQKLRGKDYKIIFVNKKYMRKDGYSLLLPEGLLDYFEIVSVEEKPREIKIYLEEMNNINQKDSAFEYGCKGFYPHIMVNIFPVRGKLLDKISYCTTVIIVLTTSNRLQFNYIH